MKTRKGNESKKNRNSIFLFFVFGLFAIGLMPFLWGKLQENGTTVVVTVDGEERYRCSLFMEKEIAVDDTNTLVIKDGVADMIFADCPDQICVKHSPISKVGETIICLPNKVVVTIEALNGQTISTRDEPDVIVR